MIHVENVSVRFGEKIVLDDFSLSLPESGVIALSGPSGCGKTTLARVLCALQKPDSGRVTGLQAGRASVMFQEDRLLPWRSVSKNLELVTDREGALAWLERLQLRDEAEAMPATLSGGMRRRVALARALAFEGELLILDEPFKGLDAALKQSIYPLIREQAQTRPVILISHEPEEIQALADRHLILDGPPLRILDERVF